MVKTTKKMPLALKIKKDQKLSGLIFNQLIKFCYKDLSCNNKFKIDDAISKL